MKHKTYLIAILLLLFFIIGCTIETIDNSTKSIPLGKKCNSNSDCKIIKCHELDSYMCTYQACVNSDFPLQRECDDNCAIEETLPVIKCECINNICSKNER